jgi:hypothetical protein
MSCSSRSEIVDQVKYEYGRLILHSGDVWETTWQMLDSALSKWEEGNLDMPQALQPSFSNLANKEFPSCNAARASSTFIS